MTYLCCRSPYHPATGCYCSNMAKATEHYAQFGWTETARVEYVCPVRRVA